MRAEKKNVGGDASGGWDGNAERAEIGGLVPRRRWVPSFVGRLFCVFCRMPFPPWLGFVVSHSLGYSRR